MTLDYMIYQREKTFFNIRKRKVGQTCEVSLREKDALLSFGVVETRIPYPLYFPLNTWGKKM